MLRAAVIPLFTVNAWMIEKHVTQVQACCYLDTGDILIFYVGDE